jgi:hypothetical protein
MEGNPCKSAMHAEQLPAGGKGLVELPELVVDRDADGLEDALGRMAGGEPGGDGHGVGHDLDELVGRLERRLGARPDERAGDRPRVALLAVVAEQRGQAALVPLVDHVGGGEVVVGIHAHVQRRVVRIGEPALARVDLYGGHAQVEVDEVGADALVAQLLEGVGEGRADEARAAGHVGRELGEALLGGWVAVDGDELAPRPQALGHQARVAAAAKRAVDGELAGLGVEELDELAGQDRDVRGGHVNQHGRRRR